MASAATRCVDAALMRRFRVRRPPSLYYLMTQSLFHKRLHARFPTLSPWPLADSFFHTVIDSNLELTAELSRDELLARTAQAAAAEALFNRLAVRYEADVASLEAQMKQESDRNAADRASLRALLSQAAAVVDPPSSAAHAAAAPLSTSSSSPAASASSSAAPATGPYSGAKRRRPEWDDGEGEDDRAAPSGPNSGSPGNACMSRAALTGSPS